jgi:hypothetical protein
LRVHNLPQVWNIHKHHQIEIPAILNQGRTYISVGTILGLKATNLMFVTNLIQQEALAIIVIGRTQAGNHC